MIKLGSAGIDPALCRLGLIGFCYDRNSSFIRGAAEAPPLIREALLSASSNLWTESGIDLGSPQIFFDAGDVAPKTNEEMTLEVEKSISALLSASLRPVSLGGDHSITHSIIRALAKHHPNISVLYFDAHPDLYDKFGERYSHACLCARIMEEKLVKRLVQVGIRTINRHQQDQAARFGVEVYEMAACRNDLELTFETPVYISIDLDALDPAYAPGVSHPEPGGLSTRQLIDMIHRVNQPVIGADIVEFNPYRDLGNMTARVCAKMLKEVSAQMLRDTLPSVTA